MTRFGNIAMGWATYAIATTAAIAILVMAHLYVNSRQRWMFVKDLSPDELSQLRAFELLQGSWREFRKRLRNRDKE